MTPSKTDKAAKAAEETKGDGPEVYGTPGERAADVNARAIDAPPVASQRVPSRRGQTDDAPRAETAGYYHDRLGKRRVLGAGQVVPDGWVRVGDRDLAERAQNVKDAHDHYPGRPEAQT
jgi:hypothetical protein